MAAAGLIGGLMSGLGSMMSAQGQAQSMEAQAAANERQAQIERQTAEYEGMREREKGLRVAGKQRTAYLSAGVSLEGSPTDIIIDSARENELDVAAIKYGGRVKAENYETQAAILRVNASNTRTAGAVGALAPIIGAFKPSGGSTNFGGNSFSFGVG